MDRGTVLSLLLGVAVLNFNLSFMILIEDFYSLNYYEYTLNENILPKRSRVETNLIKCFTGILTNHKIIKNCLNSWIHELIKLYVMYMEYVIYTFPYIYNILEPFYHIKYCFLFSNMFLLTFLLLQFSEYWRPIIVFVCVSLHVVILPVWRRDVVPVRIWRELKETPD